MTQLHRHSLAGSRVERLVGRRPTFDGRPLAMQGRASLALVTAAIASFVGGTVSIVLFTAFALALASVALSFGPPEIFALMLLAFATFVGLGGDDIPKTILSICLGLVFAAVGFDQISGAPRLVFFDSPTNRMLKVADIERVSGLAHQHGALAVLDNTFAGFHQHGDYDIDLFVHSLTKYASGAGDVMGGAVIGNVELIESLRADFNLLGAHLDPKAAYLMQRSLKTYFVRYREQCATALAVAGWLERDGRLRRDPDGSILLTGLSASAASCRRPSRVPPTLAKVLHS